ncbi:MAG: hypothetical protein GX577_03010 [Leptolinea sp.]|nr:hypothetical protein [Leptolinea sp.]
MPSFRNKSTIIQFLTKHQFLVFSFLIFVISSFVYSLHLSPSLYYDDWGQFANNFYHQKFPWFIPGFIRPLTFATYRFQTEIFGMNLQAIMIFRVFLLATHCWLFFVIFEKLSLFNSIFNFLCSLLIIFSPVDMTRMWVLLDPIMLICIQLYTICLIQYLKNHSLYLLALGILLGYGSLLYYEIQLGLLLSIPIILFIIEWKQTKNKNWWYLLPLFLGFSYVLFRLMESYLGYTSFHEAQHISVRYIVRQFLNGIICYFQGWSLPLQRDYSIRVAVITTISVVVLIFVFVFFRKGIEKEIDNANKRNLIIISAGGFFWLAGYFPFIIYGIPSYIHWFSSRAHNTSIPGFSIGLIAFCMFLGSLSPIKKNILSALAVIPFLIIGIMSQIAIQKEAKYLWNEYQSLWNGVFREIPDFVDNTHVVFVISPYRNELRYGEREFFTSASYNTELSKAIDMFYANQTIEAEFLYKDVEETDTPTLHENGIRNPPTYSGTIPYSEIIFIEFDRNNQKVKIIEDLEEEFGIINSLYNAEKHILRSPVREKTLRYIIAQ